MVRRKNTTGCMRRIVTKRPFHSSINENECVNRLLECRRIYIGTDKRHQFYSSYLSTTHLSLAFLRFLSTQSFQRTKHHHHHHHHHQSTINHQLFHQFFSSSSPSSSSSSSSSTSKKNEKNRKMKEENKNRNFLKINEKFLKRINNSSISLKRFQKSISKSPSSLTNDNSRLRIDENNKKNDDRFHQMKRHHSSCSSLMKVRDDDLEGEISFYSNFLQGNKIFPNSATISPLNQKMMSNEERIISLNRSYSLHSISERVSFNRNEIVEQNLLFSSSNKVPSSSLSLKKVEENKMKDVSQIFLKKTITRMKGRTSMDVNNKRCEHETISPTMKYGEQTESIQFDNSKEQMFVNRGQTTTFDWRNDRVKHHYYLGDVKNELNIRNNLNEWKRKNYGPFCIDYNEWICGENLVYGHYSNFDVCRLLEDNSMQTSIHSLSTQSTISSPSTTSTLILSSHSTLSNMSNTTTINSNISLTCSMFQFKNTLKTFNNSSSTTSISSLSSALLSTTTTTTITTPSAISIISSISSCGSNFSMTNPFDNGIASSIGMGNNFKKYSSKFHVFNSTTTSNIHPISHSNLLLSPSQFNQSSFYPITNQKQVNIPPSIIYKKLLFCSMPDDSHLIDDNNNNTSFRNHFSKKSKKTNRINDETFDDESQKDEDDYLELENDDNNVTMPTITNSPTATTINSTINSSSSSSSSSTTQTTTTTTGNNRRTNRMDENDICFLNHVNGRIFKSLERRGDSQFVIRELISSDQKTIIEDEMIITLPIALDRYPVQHLFPHVREVLARLNRVIGYSPHLVVFQTWKGNDESDIFIYDLRQRQPIARRLYRVFNARTYAAIISPDETLLLVTPDYDDSHSFAQASNVEATLIFSIESCNVIRATSARCDQRFAFDPRFAHNRLAEFDTVGGQIVDLRYIRPILQANHTLKTKVFRVQYTRDGSLICVVCTLPIFHRKKSRDFFIYILNSSTLLHMMQIIDFTAPANGAFIFSNTYTLLFSMYPSISIYSDTIALIRHINADPREREIVLYSLPLVATSTLKECCRRSILRYISPHFIPYLPLPASLVSFLLYKQFVDE